MLVRFLYFYRCSLQWRADVGMGDANVMLKCVQRKGEARGRRQAGQECVWRRMRWQVCAGWAVGA